MERPNPRVVLTNPVPTEGGKFNGKVTPDVYTRALTPSSSLAAIDGVLRKAGHNVSTEDSRFFSEYGVSTEEDIRRLYQCDILGISATNRNEASSLDLAQKYKAQKPNGVVVAGGFGPSMEAEKWLRSGVVDVVVRGEGDITATLVVNAIAHGESLEGIKGISYVRSDGQIINTEDAPLLSEKELSEVALPFYPDYIRNKRKAHTVNESRGCYGKCKFCCVTVQYNGTYRMKSPDRVAAEIADSRKGETVFFTGDNLAPRPKRAESLMLAKTLIAKNLKRPYMAQIDASFAQDDELIETWKKAGLFYVFQGKESINPAALKSVSKAFTAQQSIDSTDKLRKKGFAVHDMFILGIPGDTPKTIEEFREYLKKRNNATTGQLFLLTPLAGTEVGRQSKVLDFARDESNLFDGQHLVTLPPSEFSCLGLQDTAVGLYNDFFSNTHLLRSLFNDSKQLLKDPARALRLIAYDVITHNYARSTVAAMEKDPYYQEFRANLKRVDDEIAEGKRSETVVFKAGK